MSLFERLQRLQIFARYFDANELPEGSTGPQRASSGAIWCIK